MQNKWRPEGWLDAYYKNPNVFSFVAYEAGADAMLEKLRRTEIPPETFSIFLANSFITTRDIRQRGITYQGVKGKIFFIPDDPQPEMVVTYPEPDCLQKALDLDMFLLAQTPLPHKATKVVDEGYFCHICGQQVSGVWQGVCNYSRRMDLHRGIHFTSGN
jgi:hypothetical protein